MRERFTGRGRAVVVTLVVLATLGLGGPAVASAMVRHVHKGAFETGTLELWKDVHSSSAPENVRIRERYAWGESHRGALDAEGYRSCDWLGDQPVAPTAKRPFIERLAASYLREVPAPSAQIAGWRRQVLVTEAWRNLCRGDLRSHVTRRGDD